MQVSSPLNKPQSRTYLKQALDSFIQKNDKPTLDKQINLNLSGLLTQLFTQSTVYGASFRGMPSEPFIQLAAFQNICYPRVCSDKDMVFVKPDSQNTWAANQWGILEPKGGNIIQTSQLEFVLLPGIGFLQNGQRLGRGKAYYDRSLKDYKKLKIGVGYSVQWIADLWLEEAHDIKIDYLVTEKFVVSIGSKNKIGKSLVN